MVTVLLRGPTNAETAQGVDTAITTPTSTRVIGVSVSAGIATVNLTSAFAQITGPGLIVAVAQIVFTVTQEPSVTGVLFEIASQPVAVPLASGTLASAPVNRLGFAALAPAAG